MSDQFGSMPPAPPPEPGYRWGYPAEPRPPRPPSVENAVRLMWLRAAISLVSIIVTFVTAKQLKHHIEATNPGFSSGDVDRSLNVAIAIGAVVGAVILILYVLLAFQVRAGKNWARIVTWVFAGLGVLSALSSLAGTVTAASRVLALVLGIIDIAIIVLLAQRTSNRYFKPISF